jgi:hypothetical protein
VQERLWSHQERVPFGPRQYPTQRRKQQPVVELKPRLFDLPAKDRNLMSKLEDLQLLRSFPTLKEHHQLNQAAEDDV